MKSDKRRFRITSIIIAMLMTMGSLGIVSLSDHNASALDTSVHISAIPSTYPLTDDVTLWVRWSGDDGLPAYDGLSPRYGIDFYGTKTIYAWVASSPDHYTWAELANTNLFPADLNIIVNGGPSAATYIDIADHAKTDTRIKGALWEDFPVGTLTPTEVETIYDALHHEDANLTQGPLKLEFLIYQHNYYLQDWPEIAEFVDGISYHSEPSNSGVLWDEFNGFRDTVLEMRTWLPSAEFKLGILIHNYQWGPTSYVPFDKEWKQLNEVAKLIKQGYVSGFTILENVWIKSNPNEAYLVKNFLYNEYLNNYASTVNTTSLSCSTTRDGFVDRLGISEIATDATRNGILLYSKHFQRITVSNPGWSTPVVQDMLDGEFQDVNISSSTSFSFWASAMAKYRIFNQAYTFTNYTSLQTINIPTTWENKQVTLSARLFINSTLTVKNSTIRFDHYQHQETAANATSPSYGLSFGSTGILRMDNSTIEPVNRMFPYYFNTTEGVPDYTGTRAVYIHNSTLACFGEQIQSINIFQLIDSTIFMPERGYGATTLVKFQSTFCNDVKVIRVTIIQRSIGTTQVTLLPNGYPGTYLIKDVVIIGGGSPTGQALEMDNSYSAENTVFHNMTIVPGIINGSGTPISYVDFSGLGASTTRWYNTTSNFVLKGDGITSFGGVLKDSNGATIGTYSTTNGTIIQSVLWLSFKSSTLTRIHPFPWTFNVTSGLTAGYSYYVEDRSYCYNPYSFLLGPRTLAFNNSLFSIQVGQNFGLYLVKTNQKLQLGVLAYVDSSGQITYPDLAFWKGRNYSSGQFVGVFGILSTGNFTVKPTVWNTNSICWDATASSGDVIFTVSGLDSGRMYNVYIDGTRYDTLTATGGEISFTYSGPWSEHEFEVLGTSIGGSISGIVTVIFIMLAVGIIVGVTGETVNSFRKKAIPDDEMTKRLLNMVVYIVMGLALLGAVYAVIS